MASSGRRQSNDGVGDGHPLNIGQRKPEGTARGQLPFLPGDDTGQHWHHGKHTRGEGQSNAKREKDHQRPEDIFLREPVRQCAMIIGQGTEVGFVTFGLIVR